jgi:hypothetical protein
MIDATIVFRVALYRLIHRPIAGLVKVQSGLSSPWPILAGGRTLILFFVSAGGSLPLVVFFLQ